MAIGSGISAQFGMATETVVGTPVAVTRFFEMNSETLKLNRNTKDGLGLHSASSLYPRMNRRVYVSRDSGGAVDLDAPQKGLGVALQHMLGSFGATAVQQGASAAYRQIHTDGSLGGKTFTAQVGVPSTDGTVNPFTYPGCKITDWEISCAQNDLLKLKMTIDAMDELPTGAGAQALQAASYTQSTGLFSFKDGAILSGGVATTTAGLTTVAGGTTVAQVRGVSLKGSNPVRQDRWFLGQQTKGEQIENGFRNYTGQLDAEFSSMTSYGQYAADTAFALQLNFVGTIIASTFNWTLSFVIPVAFWEDSLSTDVGGPDVVMQTLPFKVYDDGSGTNPRIQAVYMSTDTVV